MAAQTGHTYTENFSGISGWTNNFAAGTGASRWLGIAVSGSGTIPNGTKITQNSTGGSTVFQTSLSSGGVQRGTDQSVSAQNIVLLATGSTNNSDATAIDFFMDYTGLYAGTLRFDAAELNNSTGDRPGTLKVYYSTDGTTFTEITGTNLPFISNNNVANSATITVPLPSAFNFTSTARLRFYYYNGSSGGTTGSRPKVTIDNVIVNEATNYYSASTGNLDAIGTWGTNTDGSGTHPTNFSTASQIFHISNGNPGNLSSNWIVSGTNARIYVDGTDFTVPSTKTVTATIDVNASRTLHLANATLPTLGTLDPASTVEFLNLTSVAVPTTSNYGNITFNNSTVALPGAIASLVFAGNFTLTGGASFAGANTTLGYSLVTTGLANQTINAGGGTLTCWSFDAGSTNTKGSGTVTLNSANTNMNVNNTFIMNLSGVTNQFSDGGNTINIINNLDLTGSATSYNFTGTINMNSAGSGSANIRGGGSSTLPCIAAVNNLSINNSIPVQVRGASGGSTFTVKGNLTVQSAATSTLVFNGNTVAVGGNFNYGPSADNITTSTAGSTLLFNGSSGQTFTSGVAGGNTLLNVTMNGSGGLTLSSPLNISGTLTLTSGKITTGTNTLTLTSTAATSGGNTSSYVNGNFLKTMSSTTSKTYEVGDATYAPITLTFSSNVASGTVSVKSTTGSHPQINTSFINLSNFVNRYWSISGSGVSPATVNIALSYSTGDMTGAPNTSYTIRNYAGSAWTTAPSIVNSTSGSTPLLANTTTSTGVSGTTFSGDYIAGQLYCPTTITGNTNVCASTTNTLTGTPSGGTWTSSAPSVAGIGSSSGILSAGTGSGNTTITYMLNTGCSITTIVTVNALPPISAGSGVAICTGGSGTTLTASGGTSYSWSPSTGLSATTGASVTANPTTTVTYTVTGSDGTCSNTATVTVTVNTSPTISAGSGVGVCTGGTGTTLTASGGTSYTWSPSTGLSATTGTSVTANPTTTVTYTVTGSNGTCSNTATVTVTVNTAPPISAGSGVAICTGGTGTTLTASGGTSYTWLPSTGLSATTGASVTANPTTTVTYTVTGSNGTCSNTATVTVTVNTTPTISVSSGVAICTGGSGTTLTASGGTSYSWSPSTGLSVTTGASVTANPTTTVTYTVTGTTSGCIGSANINVTVNPLPSMTLGANPAVCSGDTVASMSYSGTTGSPKYSLVWSDSAQAKGFRGTPGIISTIAGSFHPGEGGAATSAAIGNPYAVAVDGSGNVYFAEDRVIRKINTSGVVSTIAGGIGNVNNYSGDGGPATAAGLYAPTAISLDASGNLYISDHMEIRKVNTSGIITRVAGGATGGSLTGDGGPATSATLYYPEGLAFDGSGNMFIADVDNNVIRKVNTSGIISTVVGDHTLGGCCGIGSFSGDGGPATAAGLFNPTGVAIDGSGNIYISDHQNNRIRKVNTSGIITTIAGNGINGFSGDGGPATAAKLNYPDAVKVDAAGNVFLTDANGRVRKINTSGIITTVAGGGSSGLGDGGPATSASLSFVSPFGIDIDATNNMYIADNGHSRIRKVNGSGIINTIAGNGFAYYSGDGGPATNAGLFFNGSNGIVVDGSGAILVADQGNNAIRKINSSGIISTIAGNGHSGYTGNGGPATSAQLSAPSSLVLDGSGNLLIADVSNNVIRKINGSGVITTIAGNGTLGFSGDGGPATAASIWNPQGIAKDVYGNIYIADEGNNVIRKVNASGIISTIAGNGSYAYSGDGGPATAASIRLENTIGLTTDIIGNLFFTDANYLIRRVDTSGIISTYSGSGTTSYNGDGGPASVASLNSPYGLTMDAIGNMFIADAGNFVIRKINTLGIISTVAGHRSFPDFDITGDGGPATAAGLGAYPFAVATDGTENLYILDINLIRKVTSFNTLPSSPIPLSIPDTAPPGIYNGNIILTNGSCTGTFPFNITVNATPAISSGSVLSICTGSSTTLTATGATSYIWSPSTGLSVTTGSTVTASPTTTTTYTVTNTPSGCHTAATVTVNPLPAITPGTNPVVCAGDTVASLSYSGATGSPASYSISWAAPAISSGFMNTTPGIVTIAGNNTGGYSGDGGPATAAQIYAEDVCSDASGNIYIASRTVIRKINSSGVISTVAGNGSSGYSGDGGPATAAQLTYATGIYTANDGSLYIADKFINNVRKVDPSGIISTLAGGSFPPGGFSGDGGPATDAYLNFPSKVILDASGNIYIADENNGRVRVINSSGIISTIAGNGTSYSGDGGPATNAGLGQVVGLAFDAAGNLFIADNGSTVRKVSTSGIISTVAGNNSLGIGFSGDGGPATAGQLYADWAVATDASGNMYISDQGNSVVRIVNSTGIINTIAGNNSLGSGYSGDGGPASSAQLAYPRGISTDVAGNVYIADANNYVIRKVKSGISLPASPLPIPVPSLAPAGVYNASLTVYNNSCSSTYPITVTVNTAPTISAGSGVAICTGGSGTTLTASGGSSYYWSPSTGLSATTGTSVTANPTTTVTYTVTGSNGTCSNTAIVTVTVNIAPTISAGSGVAICSGGTGTTLTASGGSTYTWTPSTGLSATTGASVTANPTTTVTYTVTGSNGTCSNTAIVTVTVNPSPVAIAGINGSGLISTFAGNGTAGYTGDNIAAISAEFNNPGAMAMDGSGNMYISDVNNLRIRKINTAGVITTIAGDGTFGFNGDGIAATSAKLKFPQGIAVDGGGNIYFADFLSNRVRKINTSGVISTIAGNGTSGYTGDGGGAISAELNVPYGVTLDGSGNIYIADYGNSVIRKVNTSGIISTIAGTGTAGYNGDGIAATSANLNFPTHVALDATGNLYISDGGRIRKVDPSGIISTFAGNGVFAFEGEGIPATAIGLSAPMQLVVAPSGEIYIADDGTSRVRKVTTSGLVYTIAGNGSTGFSGDGGLATGAQLHSPAGIVLDATGTLFIADQDNNRIRKVLPGFTETICVGSSATFSDAVGGGTWSSTNSNASIVSGLLTGIFAGTDTISYTLSGGCYTSVYVTVNPIPTPSFTATPGLSDCAGDTVIYTTQSGQSNYIWSIPGIYGIDYLSIPIMTLGVESRAIQWLTAGARTVTVNYSNSSGCYGISPASSTTTVNAIPLISAGTGVSICTGGSGTTLTASGGTSYSWSPSSGLSATTGASVTANPTTTVTYTVTGSDGTCSNIATVTVTVNTSPTISAGSGVAICTGGSGTTLTASGGTSYFWAPSTGLSATTGASVTANPTTTVTYTVTGSNGTCSNTATVTVTVNTSPTISAGSGVAICTGGSGTTLTAFGGTSYAWLPSTGLSATTGASIVANPTTTVTYTVSGSNGTCNNTATVTVTVNTAPTISAGSGVAICSGGTGTTLTASGGTTYSWAPSLGLSATTGVSIVANPTTTVTYTVTGTTSGCSGTSTVTVTVNPSPGIITGTILLPVGTVSQLANGTSGGTWSGGSGPLSVSGSGLVSGLAAGTGIVSYTVGSCSATVTVTVNTATSLIWYSNTSGGDASNLFNWFSTNTNTGYQPGSFSTSATTWVFQSGMTSSAALTFAGNVSIVGGGTFTPASGSTTTVGGNWKNTGGTFAANGGTVLFNGANTANSADTLSGAMTGTNAFNNLTFNSPSADYTFLNNAADVSQNFLLSSGTVIAPSANLKVGANFTQMAGNFTPNSGTVTMNGASGTITAASMTTPVTSCFNNLSFNASAITTYTVSSDLVLMGSFNNITANATIALGTTTITVGGNWANAGPFTTGASHLVMNGAGIVTMTGNR